MNRMSIATGSYANASRGGGANYNGHRVDVYQENAEDLSDAAEADRRKFEVGQRLRYHGPSDETPPRFHRICEIRSRSWP